jgi:hypothetical protein
MLAFTSSATLHGVDGNPAAELHVSNVLPEL